MHNIINNLKNISGTKAKTEADSHDKIVESLNAVDDVVMKVFENEKVFSGDRDDVDIGILFYRRIKPSQRFC